jgi:DNA-binding PadR family transcriptional regulator
MARENLGDFEHQILLTVLRLGGEAYSVPIVEELEQRTGREVAQAAVFIVMRRLETKGLLTSRFDGQAAEQTGRVRRYFKLTPDCGKAWKRCWTRREGHGSSVSRHRSVCAPGPAEPGGSQRGLQRTRGVVRAPSRA